MRSSKGVIAAALVLLTPAVAHAHAHLKAASPADKATLAASPSVVRLEFSEGIEIKFSNVTITGPGDTAVKTGGATHGKGGDDVLEVAVETPLAPAAYKVEWRVLSKDGHKMKGSYSFTVKP